MPILYIVRGVPGSGKSTYVKNELIPELEESGREYVHCEADDHFIKDGKYVFVREELRKAHDECKAKMREALIKDKDAIVSNTFISKWELDSYLDAISDLQYTLKIIRITSCTVQFTTYQWT